MVICCPHALGLAIPLVVAISTTLSAQHGLLIRNRTAFENSRKISVLLFDKTGTLTTGEFGVTRYESLTPSFSNEKILEFAAAIEQHSEHPIAESIVKMAKTKQWDIPQISNFQSLPGKGVEGNIAENSIKIVSPNYLIENKIAFDQQLISNPSETLVFVLVNNQLGGFISLADQIRPESFDAIKTFHKNGIQCMMITGDNAISIPLAAGVLYHWGIVLSPAIGAVLMSLSTVIVAFNAQLLRKIA